MFGDFFNTGRDDGLSKVNVLVLFFLYSLSDLLGDLPSNFFVTVFNAVIDGRLGEVILLVLFLVLFLVILLVLVLVDNVGDLLSDLLGGFFSTALDDRLGNVFKLLAD